MLFICSMIIPYGANHSKQQLIQELDRLEALFYSLQQRAIASGLDVQLLFDITQQAYSYQTLHGGRVTAVLSHNIRFGAVPGALGPPWHATAVIQKPITFARSGHRMSEECCVTFFSNGKISTGTIYLCDQGQTRGGALTCAVSQVSSIRKYLYDGKQWQLINSQ